MYRSRALATSVPAALRTNLMATFLGTSPLHMGVGHGHGNRRRHRVGMGNSQDSWVYQMDSEESASI